MYVNMYIYGRQVRTHSLSLTHTCYIWQTGAHTQPFSPTSIRHHTSAYVTIRQHTSAEASIRQHTSAYVSIRQQIKRAHQSRAAVTTRSEHPQRARLHASAYVSIRQHTSHSIRHHPQRTPAASAPA